MATEKVTQLPTVSNSTLADIIYAVQGGVSCQQTLSQVASLIASLNVTSYAGNPNGNLAGTQYQLCFDTTNGALYVCSTTGSVTTAVWTYIGQNNIPASHGGTGVINPTSHAIAVGQGASPYHFLSLTNGQVLVGYTGNDPVPATLTAGNNVAITNGAGAISVGVTTSTPHAIPIAEGSSAFNYVTLTNGQIPIGSTGADPVAANLTAGTNISITNSAGGITINAANNAAFTWNSVTGTSATMASNNGYIANNASLITLTLPTISSVGDIISVVGKGAGGWKIAQNASQIIYIGSQGTTIGASGYLSSTNSKDTINIVCTVANTEWIANQAPIGNITYA